ncbi:DUF397 domain-containing protein [Streptomyces sp. NPDC049602]|uniref:DUF397 domain-containing protein n=1 Tax=Streptomyces sp. NPDC049602 TaxID=3155504 RepID=UPI00341D11DC
MQHRPPRGQRLDQQRVEVATCPTTVHVRDSKNPTGPQLALSPITWTEFLSRLG